MKIWMRMGPLIVLRLNRKVWIHLDYRGQLETIRDVKETAERKTFRIQLQLDLLQVLGCRRNKLEAKAQKTTAYLTLPFIFSSLFDFTHNWRRKLRVQVAYKPVYKSHSLMTVVTYILSSLFHPRIIESCHPIILASVGLKNSEGAVRDWLWRSSTSSVAEVADILNIRLSTRPGY